VTAGLPGSGLFWSEKIPPPLASVEPRVGRPRRHHHRHGRRPDLRRRLDCVASVDAKKAAPEERPSCLCGQRDEPHKDVASRRLQLSHPLRLSLLFAGVDTPRPSRRSGRRCRTARRRSVALTAEQDPARRQVRRSARPDARPRRELQRRHFADGGRGRWRSPGFSGCLKMRRAPSQTSKPSNGPRRRF
jgi:hypothetical protein